MTLLDCSLITSETAAQTMANVSRISLSSQQPITGSYIASGLMMYVLVLVDHVLTALGKNIWYYSKIMCLLLAFIEHVAF